MPRLTLASMLALSGLAGLGGALASPAMAQMSHPSGQDRRLDAPLVDWSHAQQVYRQAEGWIKQGDAGSPLAGDAVDVTGVSGVRVTIRWMGLRMGTGQSSIETIKPVRGQQVYDLTDLTRHAVRGAMLEVNEKLRQSYLRAMEAQAQAGEEDAEATTRNSQPRSIRELAGQLLLDIQIAGPLEPVRIAEDAPRDAVFHQFAPGYHGLHMSTTRGDVTLSSWVWPGDALSAGQSPNHQILQLMGGLGLKLDQQPRIGKPGMPALARFQVIHLVRPGLIEPITRLTRGNVLLPPTSVDESTLDNLTLRLVEHLRQRQRENGQFAGTYLPSTDTYQSKAARLEDAALACLALSRWTTSGVVPAASRPVMETNEAIRQWLNANLPGMLKPESPANPAAMALSLLILVDNPAMAGRQVERDMLARRLLALRGEDGSFQYRVGDKDRLVDTPVAALIVNSLSAYYLQSRQQTVEDALPLSMQWVWERTDPLRSIGALPWLLEADARLERLTDEQGQNPLNPRGARSARLARLIPTIDLVMQRQIVTAPAVGPADVIGGFELTVSDADTPPSPDWRTSHLMMVISQSMRSKELSVGRSQVNSLLTCGRAARFLGQLMFDEPGAYYARSVQDVVGGVRPVLWDNRLDLSPTAMTLLACCDLKITLNQIAQENR